VGLGLAVGASSTAYSLIDRAGVALVPPPVYLALQMLGTALLMGPAWLGRKGPRARLGRSVRGLIGPALLCATGILGAYGLVLVAMTRAPVAYVAAGREIAIVFGTLLGAIVLREPVTPARALGALLVTLGIVLLAMV
jgi:drug/metabolite transporter (DMT)-like permease